MKINVNLYTSIQMYPKSMKIYKQSFKTNQNKFRHHKKIGKMSSAAEAKPVDYKGSKGR